MQHLGVEPSMLSHFGIQHICGISAATVLSNEQKQHDTAGGCLRALERTKNILFSPKLNPVVNLDQLRSNQLKNAFEMRFQ